MMKSFCQEETGKKRQRSYEKLGNNKSSSSLGIMTSLTGGSTGSVVRKKLYKSSIQKAKEILRIKMMGAGLALKMAEKRVMAESLMATKRDAEETEANYGLLNIRRNQLMDELSSVINDFVRLRALEILLMVELDFL